MRCFLVASLSALFLALAWAEGTPGKPLGGTIAGAKLIVHENSEIAQGERGRVVIENPHGCSDADLERVAGRFSGDAHVDSRGHPSKGGLCSCVVTGTLAEIEAALQQEREVEHGLITDDTIVETDQVWGIIPDMGNNPADLRANPQANLRGSSGGPSGGEPISWGLDRIDDKTGLDKDFTPGLTGKNVHVFVLDTGIRTTHMDFGGRAIPALEFLSDGAIECDPTDTECAMDRDGHGTHCAGTIGGELSGVAKKATLHAVKVLADDGFGSFSWFLGALDWVMQRDLSPKIVSASLGGPGRYRAIDAGVTSAVKAGITVVVAAGNQDDDACKYSPANVRAAVTVGATNPVDHRAWYSNYGRCVDIFAPGSEIVSASNLTDDSGATLDGTSMAAPHVAGTAALILEVYPSWEPLKVAHVLKAISTKGRVMDRKGSPNRLLRVPQARRVRIFKKKKTQRTAKGN